MTKHTRLRLGRTVSLYRIDSIVTYNVIIDSFQRYEDYCMEKLRSVLYVAKTVKFCARIQQLQIKLHELHFSMQQNANTPTVNVSWTTYFSINVRTCFRCRMFLRCSSTLFQKLLHLTTFSIDCVYSFVCKYYTSKCFICSFIQIETWYYFILLLLYYIAQSLYQEKHVKILDIVSLQIKHDSTFQEYNYIHLWNNENLFFMIRKFMCTALYIWQQ